MTICFSSLLPVSGGSNKNWIIYLPEELGRYAVIRSNPVRKGDAYVYIWRIHGDFNRGNAHCGNSEL